MKQQLVFVLKAIGYPGWRIGGVSLPHPPAPSPKREGEARLLGFVDFWVRILTSISTS